MKSSSKVSRCQTLSACSAMPATFFGRSQLTTSCATCTTSKKNRKIAPPRGWRIQNSVRSAVHKRMEAGERDVRRSAECWISRSREQAKDFGRHLASARSAKTDGAPARSGCKHTCSKEAIRARIINKPEGAHSVRTKSVAKRSRRDATAQSFTFFLFFFIAGSITYYYYSSDRPIENRR